MSDKPAFLESGDNTELYLFFTNDFIARYVLPVLFDFDYQKS
jgi:hypothetical protein